jgi:hypothetical protein
MGAHAVAAAADIEDDGVVDKAVDDGADDDLVGEDLTPIRHIDRSACDPEVIQWMPETVKYLGERSFAELSGIMVQGVETSNGRRR